MRRIVVLALVACAILIWGKQTLESVWQGEADILEANKTQLERVMHLRAFERSLDDLNTMVEEPLTNSNKAAQTRLVLALQDQRGVLWRRLEPLKEAIGKDPIRLEGVESQLEALGKQVGELVKILVKDGQSEAQKVRQDVWTKRFLVVRKSVRRLSNSLQNEAEKQWQVTRIAQDKNLRRLIIGSGAVAAFALLWVGFLLTRSKGRQGKMHQGIDALAGALAKPADGDSPETRLDALLAELKTAPVGARFLSRLLASSSAPGALLVEGKVRGLSKGLENLLGEDAIGQELPDLLRHLDLETNGIVMALSQSNGEWIKLKHIDESPSSLSLRAHVLTHGSLRYVELRDARKVMMGQTTSELIGDFANNHLLTATLELDGQVAGVNPATCDYLGASESDLQVAHLTDFDLGLEPDAIATIIGSIQKSGRWVGEVQLQRAHGPGLVVAQITKISREPDNRELLSVIAIAKDELAQARAETQNVKAELAGSESSASMAKKQLGAERHRLTTEATAAMQSFSHLVDLINGFGREIRDPLNGAVGLTELLADTGDAQRIGQLRTVNDTLINLVYCLLDHANLESDNLEFHTTAVDLEQIVQPIVMRYVRHLKGSDVRIEFKPNSQSLPQAHADATRVRQILDAIIARATCYALPGGLVRVQLDSDGSGQPRCQIFDAGGVIPSIAQDEIFAVTSYSGAPGEARWSGMEPAVLHALAQGMQAELVATAGDNEMVWSFTLPIAQGVTEVATTAKDSSHPPRVTTANDEDLPPVINASVLVADDDEVNRLVATGLLERMGCAPVVVEDGEEAVAQLKSYLETGQAAPFDLILLDLMMPRMDGLSAAAMIRQAETEHGIPEARRIPIVAVTAKASDADEETCLSIGMNGFVSKPYRHDELQALIASFTA